jgi:hypothetical protein
LDQAEGRLEAKIHLSSGTGTRHTISALLMVVINRRMSNYAPDVVLFDVVDLLQYIGTVLIGELRKAIGFAK